MSEAWAKLRDWASVAGRGRLLLSGSVAHASLKTAVDVEWELTVHVFVLHFCQISGTKPFSSKRRELEDILGDSA